jgi:hypothetical protein
VRSHGEHGQDKTTSHYVLAVRIMRKSSMECILYGGRLIPGSVGYLYSKYEIMVGLLVERCLPNGRAINHA